MGGRHHDRVRAHRPKAACEALRGPCRGRRGRARSVTSIDCLVHPLPARGDDLRAYLREPWKSKAMPGPTRYWYPNPVGEFHPVARSETGLPGSDPATLARHVLGAGARTAIL